MTEIEVLALTADELEEEIRRHNRLYWDDAKPEIPDAIYDLMVERIRHMRPESTVLSVLGPEDLSAERVVHSVPMLSLDKCYTEPELLRWFERFTGPAVVTPKVDGVAMMLRYDERGRLVLAATRGDGVRGERITNNARRVIGIPERIDRGPLEVRGEAYMALSDFRGQWAEQFANPRNLTAGALKLKDADRTAAYGIRFFAYEAFGLDEIPSDHDRLARLAELGFEPVPAERVDRDGAQAAFEAFVARRDQLDYETDGVVFRVDDSAQHDALGRTAHHPRFAIAYKFQGESGFSVLRDIEWSVSRTGKINPVALIDPVSLSGVTVRRVSLHNLGIMEALGDGALPALGARVLVTRRGGVIPHIEAIAEPGTEPIELPERCPSCGADVRREDDFLVADHAPDCVTTALRRLQHFASAVDIQGLGPKVLQQLFDADEVREPADLYLLTPEAVARLDRMGERSARNIIDAIEARRTIRMSALLAGLGIRDLGQQVALALEQRYESMDALRRATAAELETMDGIGPVVSQRIVEGLNAMTDVLDRLMDQVSVERATTDGAAATEGPLAGMGVVFTGELERLSRKDAQERVRGAGGHTPSSVTSDLDLLVLGDADHARFEQGWRSSKLRKAEALIQRGSTLRIISESEFFRLIGVED